VLDGDLIGAGGGTYALRPERVSVHAPPRPGDLVGVLDDVSYQGAFTRLDVRVGLERVAAVMPASVAPPPLGTTVGLAWDPDALHRLEDA
jgi:putative spermidine/putrescine transport system ATP-binding protein